MRTVARLAKSVAAACVLAGTVGTAQAKLTPLTPAEPTRTPDVWAIYLGPIGAMLESDYFRAPHGTFKSRQIRPCRLHRHENGDELRLAYSCH